MIRSFILILTLFAISAPAIAQPNPVNSTTQVSIGHGTLKAKLKDNREKRQTRLKNRHKSKNRVNKGDRYIG